MGILALKIAGKKNGVSKLHGEVSRELFGEVWPDIAANESPITYVTNGIHTCSWLAPNLKKLYNEYTNKRPAQTDYMVVFQQKKILARKLHGRICLPRLSDLLADGMSLNENADSQYLFRINEEQYFLYPDLLNPDVMSDVQWISLAQIRSQAEHEICFAAYTAYHLYQWYQSNRFCGCCGSRTVPDQQERMLYCTQCGNQIYPRISPAVIVAVTNGDQILLTRYANREYQRYALVAGFTEIGETAEETVRR